VATLMVAVQFYDLNRQNRTEIETLQTNTLINEAQTLAQQVDALVRNETSRVVNLSLSRAAQEFISVRPNQRSALFTPTLADFTNFLASNRFYRAVLLLDRQGEVLISTDGSYVGQNFANSAFFEQANRGEPVMSDPSISRRDRQAVIWLAAPVYTTTDDRPGGVVAVALSPEALWDSVESYQIGQHGYAILVDDYGIRLAHGRDRRYIFRSLVPLSPEVWANLQTDGRFDPLESLADTGSWALWDYLQQDPLPSLAIHAPSDQSGQVYYSATTLSARNWTVVAMLPESEILAPASRVTLRGLWGSLILILFLAVTGVWMVKRLVRPVPQLVQAARKIAHGDLDSPVQVQGSSELGELAESFEVMRQRLQDSHQQLTAWTQELEHRVAQRSQELTALSEVVAFASRSQSKTEFLITALNLALRVMGAEMGGIWMAEKEDTLRLRAQHGFDHELSQELTTFAPGEGLIGQVQASGAPVALDDISQAPLLARAVVRERSLHAFAAVPLRIHGRNLGVLGVFSRSHQPFSPEVISLAASIAQQIALTLDNMNLLRQVRSQAQNVARLQERERIAAEIHDSMAQTHSYIYLQVDRLADEASGLPRAEIKQYLVELRDIIAQLSSETRQFIAQLRDVPPPPPTRLAELVQKEIERLAPELTLQVQLNLAQTGDLVLPEATGAELARIVGEAVRNAQRHGQAEIVQITFQRQNGQAFLQIHDNGLGFDPQQTPEDGRSHFGLSVMQARAARIGGSLNITSRPGSGTLVQVYWPIQPESLR
jgi:two-component system nitrate/nitrite sensor histidine kinase NarX